MPDTTLPYQIVIFTLQHSITGGVFLHDQRLSDFLNDRRQTSIFLRNASVARLEDPAKILEKTVRSVIPKIGIMLVFEPPQKAAPPPRRFINYPKERHEVFLALDGMEVRGFLHVQGPLDLLNIMTNAAVLFLPLTQATVTFDVNPNFVLKGDAIMVNTQLIRFMGELPTKSPATPPPPATPVEPLA